MDDPILFNPDNRLLGGATGDFSLYGGQSDPKFSIQQARDDAPVSQDAPAIAQGSMPAASTPDSALAAPDLSNTAEQVTESGAGSLAPASYLISAPQTSFEPISVSAPVAAGQVLAPASPAPQGAGSIIPATAPANSALSDAGAASAPALPLDDISGAAEPGLPGIVADTTAPVADTAETLVGGVTDTVSEAAEGAEGIVTGTAATLLADLAAGTSGVAAEITETTGAAVDTTLGAVDETLEGLVGSDPLGGVATLVNLVSVSDMFDLNPIDVPLPNAAGDSGLGLVDVLAGEDLLPDTLLGTHQDDGLLGGDHSDNPLGL